MSDRQLEAAGQRDFGPCECCGGLSRSVWGYVHQGKATEAAYFIQWTPGHLTEHGAHFDLIVGAWGDDAAGTDRYAVSLEFRHTERGPVFMVIDSASRPVAKSDLVGRALSRSEVIGTPLAQQAFDLVDFIWLQERRIEEVRGGRQC
jgi:hypothetical protein